MHKLLIVSLILFTACALPNKGNIKRVDTSNFYTGGNVIGYFLPDMPEWVMVSESGQCARGHRIKYLDIPILRRSFGLNYTKAHQMQLMFNLELEKKLKNLGIPVLGQKEEEALFYQILDQIGANFMAFHPPTYKQVNLIWIDPAINDQVIYQKLKKLVSGPVFDSGHPVFLSSCLGQSELESFATKLGVGSADVRYVSYEMLSMFNFEDKKEFEFGLDIDQFFDPSQKLNLWSPYNEKNRAFRGKLIYQKY